MKPIAKSAKSVRNVKPSKSVKGKMSRTELAKWIDGLVKGGGLRDETSEAIRDYLRTKSDTIITVPEAHKAIKTSLAGLPDGDGEFRMSVEKLLSSQMPASIPLPKFKAAKVGRSGVDVRILDSHKDVVKNPSDESQAVLESIRRQVNLDRADREMIAHKLIFHTLDVIEERLRAALGIQCRLSREQIDGISFDVNPEDGDEADSTRGEMSMFTPKAFRTLKKLTPKFKSWKKKEGRMAKSFKKTLNSQGLFLSPPNIPVSSEVFSDLDPKGFKKLSFGKNSAISFVVSPAKKK